MAYDAVEILEFFEPRELYKFTRDTFSWYFTTGDTDITFGGQVYLAVPMKRKAIESTQDIGKTPLKILCSRTNPFALQYLGGSPTAVVTLEIIRQHAEDPLTVVSFKGRVINVGFKEDEATITCQSNQSSLLRPGLRRLYQTACPHVLYGDQCEVVKATFKTTATLDAVAGSLITSTSFIVSVDPLYDSTWFVGGVVEFIDGDGLLNQRFIKEHDNIAGTLTLTGSLAGAIVASSVDVYPGCGHDTKTCNEKFTNIEHYGGFPFIPKKNPQDGTSIF